VRPARPVGIHDLPPDKRKALEETAARHPSTVPSGQRVAATTTEPGRRANRPNGRPRFRCHQCGHAERAYKAAERHAHSSGHYRIELVLR